MDKRLSVLAIPVLTALFLVQPVLGQSADLAVTITNPANNAELTVGQTTTFSGSVTGGNGMYIYLWNFGDGTQGAGQQFDKTYTDADTYPVTLTVTDTDGLQGAASIQVNVTDGGTQQKPIISNLRVTDITSSSVIVRWETDIPADSRVIYDLVSHPDISGQSEPNFGYANSTATQDSGGVTSHAVTITGLSAQTTYFIRALSRGI